MAEATGAAAVAPTTPTTPAPEAPPTGAQPEAQPSARGMSMDDVFAAFDAAGDGSEQLSLKEEAADELGIKPIGEQKPDKADEEPKEAAKEEAADEEEGPELDPDEDPEAWEDAVHADPEKMSPHNLRALLKSIPDPKARRILAERYLLAGAYRDAGVRLSDIKRIKALAPSADVIEDMAGVVTNINEVGAALNSRTPAGALHVVKTLHQASPEGFRYMTEQMVENLHKFAPEVHRKFGDGIVGAVIANLRSDARKKDDPVLADTADVLAQYVGLERAMAETGDEEETQALPDEVKRKLEEAEALKQKLAEARKRAEEEKLAEAEQYARQFHQSVVETAEQNAASTIKDWIEEHAGQYSDRVKHELWDRMAKGVYETLIANPRVNESYRRVLMSGRLDQQHHSQSIEFINRQVQNVLPSVAIRVLRDTESLVRDSMVSRKGRIEKNMTRREVGSGGSASVVPATKPLSGKGKTMDQVLAEFDNMRG